MPQLDSFTYLTQVIWLFFFVFTYYLLLINNALPTISRLLKLRKQLTAGSALTELQANGVSSASNFDTQLVEQPLRSGQIAWDVCKFSRQFLSETVENSTHWYNQQLSKINKKQFQKLHKKSVGFLGQYYLWLVLTSQIFSSALSLSKAQPIAKPTKIARFLLKSERCFFSKKKSQYERFQNGTPRGGRKGA